MTQFTIGTRVRVTAATGGLFYSGNKDKVGVVTRNSRAGEIIHVRFDDGVEDYGRPVDLEVVTTSSDRIVVGSKVRVKNSVVFLGCYKGQTGTVYRADGRTIYVQFDGGRDYGMIDELELVFNKDKDGFISNAGNTEGKLPAPRGTLMDVLYNDGTLILDIAIGTGTQKRASNNHNSYSATTWVYNGKGSATIKAYRFLADRPAPATAGVRITHAEMKEGMQVRYLGAARSGHEHWNFNVGQVYSCGNGGPINAKGTLASNNWGDWSWELVEQTATLDQQLAALRAEVEAANTEKREAQTALTAARQVYDAAEAKRVAVEARLTKHGLRLI